MNRKHSTLTSLAVTVARRLPVGFKSWVHNHRRLDGVSRWLFRTALGDEFVSIEDGPLAGLRLAVSEHISHAHIRGTYERQATEAIARLLRPNDVCYDLGASIGYLSLLMARNARFVYCFEPAPHAATEIVRSMAANGFKNYAIVPSPVTDSVRQVRFAITDVAYGSAISEQSTRWPELMLTSTTLDRFIQGHDAPDFVKMDVEGEEDHVLAGAGTLLARRSTVFCCELHSPEDVSQCRAIFDDHEYVMTALDGSPVQWDADAIPGEFHIVARPYKVLAEGAVADRNKPHQTPIMLIGDSANR
jgi:FkbM family methyltransferase